LVKPQRRRATGRASAPPKGGAAPGAQSNDTRRVDAARSEVEPAPTPSIAIDPLADALEAARRAREQLATGLVNERRMMANEVHDSLAQGLTYMRMRMSLLRDAIRQGDEGRALRYWGDVDSSLTNAHRRLRELITYFRTRMDSRGLVHVLAEMSESFFDRTGVALEFANHVPDLQLPVGREVQVFHIVQEGLANVCKHADARRARLSLERKGDGYEIVIEDDGVGMVADPTSGEHGRAGHYGIAIMRERAHRLGGELTLHGAPGAGTRVRLYFPAVQPQAEDTL
jgi:two-component system nitrate/nitrite sensor histidine kinase NarX